MIRILVPLDGSPAAEKAIPHAVAIARAFSAEMELLGVVDNSSGSFGNPINSLDWQLAKLQTETYLSRTAVTLSERGIRTGWELREGDPAQEIIQAVRAADIDILVMTRFGNGNAQQFRMGGTVQKVLSSAVASILLADPAHEFDSARGYERIVVALDGSQCSEWAAAFAAVMTQAFGGALHMLRIVEEPTLPGGTPVTVETRRFIGHIKRMARSQASLQLQNVVSTIPPNVRTSTEVAFADNVPATISHAMDRGNAELLVVAAPDDISGRDGYGPVCDALLSRLRRPVLVCLSASAALPSGHFRSVYLDEAETRADVI